VTIVMILETLDEVGARVLAFRAGRRPTEEEGRDV